MKHRRQNAAPVRPTRVLLDNNVWRYVLDENAARGLVVAAQTGNCQILVAPSVVYEVLRLEDVELRHRLIELLTLSKWMRLMPEAYTESRELLHEIRRLKPEWLRQMPNRNAFMRLRHHWGRTRNGFWERARSDPSVAADYLRQSGDHDYIEAARSQARVRRDEFKDASWSETAPLESVYMTFKRPDTEWSGTPIEAWRFDGWTSITYALGRKTNAYTEWLAPDVDLGRMMRDNQSWLKFWFKDIDVRYMPRFWLRWATEYLQRFRRVDDGTPCDAQLAPYLLEADLFLSGDKRFIGIVEKCRFAAPFPLPRGERIPGGSPGVAALFSHLSNSGT